MKILLVDDDTQFARHCIEALLRDHHEGAFAPDAISARRKMADEEYDLIIIDLMLPPSFGVEGLDLLKSLKLRQSNTPVIMITSKAFKTTNTVSEAMKLGAVDFIDKDEPLFEKRLLVAIQEIQSPSKPVPSARSVRPIVVYGLAFIVLSSFTFLLAYLVRDFTIKNIIVLSAFLFLCLVSLVLVIASAFLETGKIDKQQWYKITTDKVLSGPLALIKSLRRWKTEDKEEPRKNSLGPNT